MSSSAREKRFERASSAVFRVIEGGRTFEHYAKRAASALLDLDEAHRALADLRDVHPDLIELVIRREDVFEAFADMLDGKPPRMVERIEALLARILEQIEVADSLTVKAVSEERPEIALQEAPAPGRAAKILLGI